jgi:hypothetical protein
MKAQSIVINVLVAAVAALASHIFWPGSPVAGRVAYQAPVANAASVPGAGATSSGPAPVAVAHPPAQAAPFVTPEIRAQLDKARQPALVAHPQLKSEENDLNQQLQALMKQKPPASSGGPVGANGQMEGARPDPSLKTFFAELDGG